MKILNTKELNEKLNIQPVTKQQLSNHGREMWVNTKNWKDRLKTGDILFIRMIRRDDDGIVQHESLMCFRYVTFEDYFRYGYSFGANFENHIRSKKESKYGMLITYDHNKKTFRCIFLSTFYRDSSMTTNLVGNETTVTEIKRPVGTIEQPIKSEFFIRDNIKNTDTVCIYKDKSLNEKLDIQPVSKERLRNTIVSPKKLLKTGDIVVSEMRLGETRTGIYISMYDYANYDYGKLLNMATIPFSLTKEGIIVRYKQANTFTFTSLLNLNDKLENELSHRYTTSVYRHNNIEQPLPFDYFKHPNTDNASIIYKREGDKLVRVNEKLNIQPISKEELVSQSGRANIGWKHNLQTGDAVFVTRTATTDISRNRVGSPIQVLYYYISKYDYFHLYKDIFKFNTLLETNKEVDEGLLVRYNSKDNTFSYNLLSRFDNKTTKANVTLYADEYIESIYRNEKVLHPLYSRNFFVEYDKKIENGWTLVKQFAAPVTEKLEIHPVSKEKLKSYTTAITKPKSLLKTGYIVIGNDIKQKEFGLVYIYIAKSDYAKYKTLGFDVDKYEDITNDGIFLRYEMTSMASYNTYRFVSFLNNMLTSNTFEVTDILKDKNQPNQIDYDYLKTVTGKRELPTDTTTIWKRLQTMK